MATDHYNKFSSNLVRWACFIPLSGYSTLAAATGTNGIKSIADLDKFVSVKNQLTDFEKNKASTVHYLWHQHVAILKYWTIPQDGGRRYVQKRTSSSTWLRWIKSCEYLQQNKDKQKKQEQYNQQLKEIQQKQKKEKEKGARKKLNQKPTITIPKIYQPKMREFYDGGSNIQSTSNLLFPILPRTIKFHDS